MDGLEVVILDTASRTVDHATPSWPIPPSAVGPTLIVAILLLLLIALWDVLALKKGPRR